MTIRVLVDLKPALDGLSGIPIEARALFATLLRLPGAETHGLIQDGASVLPPPGEAEGLIAGARAIAALGAERAPGRLNGYRHVLRRMRYERALARMARRGRPVATAPLPGADFADFVWQRLFAPSLPPSDAELVGRADYRTAWVPRSDFQLARARGGRPLQLDTDGFDAFVCQSPFPGRVPKGTRLIVRYHDAVPLFLPHTIQDRQRHLAIFEEALALNVADGATFACVSDASRRDLVRAYPEAAPRAHVIHNAVGAPFGETNLDAEAIPDILAVRGGGTRTDTAPRYLLCVATMEPRKNHLTLVRAWERVRARQPDLALVLVGGAGWGEAAGRLLDPWMREGAAHRLTDVPARELAALYRHAVLTVCPSSYEGFDFSGVEALRSGGTVLASDIPVHREVLGDAARYFSTYDDEACAEAISTLTSNGAEIRRDILAAAPGVVARYEADRLRGQWQALLEGG